MTHSAILPTSMNQEMINSELGILTYTFNRWLKMLNSYGKLDTAAIDGDFSTISRVIKHPKIKGRLRNAIATCRDYALAGREQIFNLINALRHALTLMCEEQEDDSIIKVAKNYSDQGMTERYRYLTRKLKREKIRRLDKGIMFTDVKTDDSATTKLVRRFVEKRAAQAVHRQFRNNSRESNKFRQSVRRATSFSLYNASITDYDVRKRAPGTHWKVIYKACNGKKILKNKHSYQTYEDAMDACRRYSAKRPEDTRPMMAYKCGYCNKWHIGHTHDVKPILLESKVG